MTMKAVFSYSNPDATTDMNAHFRILFNKGVVSGGAISPIGGTFQVSVAPFAAVSADGMVIEQDEATVVSIPSTVKGVLYHIVLVAQYNAPSAPTLKIQVISDDTYVGSTSTYFIILGSVTIPAGATSVLDSHISYDYKDATAKIGYLNVKGALSVQDAPPLTKNKAGDLYVVFDSTPPYFVVWSGSAWIKFTDYSQLESDYTAHVTDHGDFTGATATTDARHVTKSMKAALAGTSGTPGADNKFVTEADESRTLGTGERAGLTGAVGGTLSSTNPVVSKNMAVLEERVIAYTSTTGGQTEASVSSSINGTTVSVFVGTRGKDVNLTGDEVSTARQFFRVEDAFGKGLVLADGSPVYVKNVALSGVTYDTASATTVSDDGFWDGTGALSVKFNQLIPAGIVFYVRFNIRGNITALSPSNRATGASGRYAVPPTGYQNRVDSYTESYVVNANTVLAETINVGKAGYFAAGSQEAPSVSFSVDKTTGMYYVGTYENNNFSDYSGLGFSVNGQSMLVLGRAASNIDITATHFLEADIDENGNPYHKWSLQNGGTSTSASERNVSFMFGTSNYLTDFEPFFGIRYGTTPLENFNKYSPYVSIQHDMAIESFTSAKYKLSVMSGTDKAPSLVFDRSNSGFYYFESIGDTHHTMYKGVGVSIDGAPLVMFGNNSTNTTYNTNSILMVERENDSPDLRFGLWSGGNGPGALSIGYANYLTDWHERVRIADDLTINTTTIINDNVTANNVIATYESRADNFIAKVNGSATSPAFKFSGSYAAYGIFISSPTANNDLTFGPQLQFSVAGRSQLSLGRDPWTVGSSAEMNSPLMVNSFANGASEFGYNISVPYMSGGASPNWKNTISFGASYYMRDFERSLTMTTASGGHKTWYLEDDLHVAKSAGIYFHNGVDIEDDTSAIRLRGITSTFLGNGVLFDGSLAAYNKLVIGRDGPDAAELVLGSVGITGAFDETNSTLLRDWSVRHAAPLDTSITGDLTLANVNTLLLNLIHLLGANGTTAQLHALFQYI